MDQVKTGKFIAQLRKEKEMTQEELGEKLGVTNKTVSRWETGVYMPTIDILQSLSREFDISINELLAGERIESDDFKKKADENVIAIAKQSAFTYEERKKYFTDKWKKEHIPFTVFTFAVPLIIVFVSIYCNYDWIVALAPIIAVIFRSNWDEHLSKYVNEHLYED